MSGRRLIVNADGYGFTAGVNRGIEEAIDAGTVTSISVNANFDAAAGLGDLAARAPQVSVGVHLNPIVGRPLADPADVPTLVNEHGEFHYDDFRARLRARRIDAGELRHEMDLQIQRTRELAPRVTHLDSHQNSHLWFGFFGLFVSLAARHGIRRIRSDHRLICVEFPDRRARARRWYARNPLRAATQTYGRLLMVRARRSGLRMPDRTLRIGACSDRVPMMDAWLQMAAGCPVGTNAVHCHPGYVDDELRRWARVIVKEREDEREALKDPRLLDAFARHGIELTSFDHL